jgi:DNA repair protein RadA/Sms
MAKCKSIYSCQACGYQSAKWLGRCPACSEWNTMVEEIVSATEAGRAVSVSGAPQVLSQITSDHQRRFSTRIEEFDRVLGGGIVPGSLILVGGDPGIGKSTLLLQASCGAASGNGPILYVSGEESASQIKLRAQRLKLVPDNLYVVNETCLEAILQHISAVKPQLFILDSIQTTYTQQLSSAPGSIAQVRQVTAELLQLCKTKTIAGFIIGHVTKEGAVAGPRTMEHLVDTVLYLEGERFHSYRILRAAKNRFGSTSEIGVFEMKNSGLEEILNPSELFLAQRSAGVSGSLVLATVEGTRPILVELQALVSGSNGGIPRRNATGVDMNRLLLMLAVIENRLGLHIQDQDVYVNVAGGLRVDEPAADLGIILALISSFRRKSISDDLVVMGEVGLGGEIRGVTQVEARLKEAAQLGFTQCLLPKCNLDKLSTKLKLDLIGTKLAAEAVEVILGE